MSGERLRTFSIIVGPNNGTYKKCGSSRNNLSSAEARVFSCEPNAKGSSLKIQIKGRRDLLTLCEVFIFGRGKSEVKCDIEINNTD